MPGLGIPLVPPGRIGLLRLRVAMQILRHSKIAVTMEIYAKGPPQAYRAALRKLGAWNGAQGL